jgi:hypothetical protein
MKTSVYKISSSRKCLNVVYLALSKESKSHVQAHHQDSRTIRSEQALNAFIAVVRKNLPLELRNTRITAEDIL